MNPNTVTALATIALTFVTVVLACFAYLTINEQRKERTLEVYMRLSKICDDVYVAMVHVSEMITKEELYPIILYYICDEARIGQPKVYWNRILGEMRTSEKDQYYRLIDSKGSPEHLRQLYYELFYLGAILRMFASKEIYRFWEDFLRRTEEFMENLQYKCTELISSAEKAGSHAEEEIKKYSSSITRKKLGVSSIDLARETDEYNVTRKAFQRQMKIEMSNKSSLISKFK